MKTDEFGGIINEPDKDEFGGVISKPAGGFGKLRQVEDAMTGGAAFGKLHQAEEGIQPQPPEPNGAIRAMGTASGFGIGLPQNQQELNALGKASAAGSGAIAGMVAPEMLPASLSPAAATGTVGLLGRYGLQGALSGGAQDLTEQVLNGKLDPAELAASTAVGGVGNAILGPAIQKLAQIGTMAWKEGWRPGGSMFKGAVAGALKPLTTSETAAARNTANEAITKLTGETVPISAGEALDVAKQESRSPRIPGLVPAEDLDRARRAVSYAAVHLVPTSASADTIADAATSILKAHAFDVDAALNKAIEGFSNDASDALRNAGLRAEQTGRAAIGAATSRHDAGNEIREAVQANHENYEEQVKNAFDEVRATPPYDRIRQTPSHTQEAIDAVAAKALEKPAPVEAGGLLDQYGIQIPSTETEPNLATLAPEVRSTINRLRQSIGTEQSLDNLRRFRSQLFQEIYDPASLPGIPERDKWSIYHALSQDIDDAVSKLPTTTLKTKLQAANKLVRENADNFKNAYASGILKEPGIERGRAPGTIFQSLTGANAESNLALVQKMSGANFPKVLDSVRRGLAGDIADEAFNPVTGTFDLGKVVSKLNEVRANAPQTFSKLFPDYNNVVNAAKQAAAAQGLAKLKPDKAFEAFTLTPQEFTSLMTPGEGTKVAASAKLAFDAQAARQRMTQNSIFNDVLEGKSAAIQRNPREFLRAVLSGSYKSAFVDEAAQLLGRSNPQVLQDVQSEFMANLLDKATRPLPNGRAVDPHALASLIREPVAGPTKAQGELYDTAKALLGPEKLKGLQEMTELLKQSGTGREPSFFQALTGNEGAEQQLYAATRIAGHPEPINFIRAFFAPKNTKLVLAAHLIDSQELRQLAAKPVSRLTRENLAQLSTALQRFSQQKETHE